MELKTPPNEVSASVSLHAEEPRLRWGRVLYLIHRTPFPPNRGDRIRSYHILRHLSQRFRIDLAALSDEPVPASDERELKAICERVCILRQPSFGRWRNAAGSFIRGRTATQGLFWSASLADVVRQWSRRESFDAVIACCSSMGQYLLLPELKPIPSIVDLIDVDSQKWIDYASSTRGLRAIFYRQEGERLRDLEAKLAAHAKAVLLVNEKEAALFRSVVPNQRTVSVTNGVDVTYFRACEQETTGPFECVFVGVLDYRPNVEGLQWFCNEVWPAVRKSRPDARLTIVGRSPTSSVRKFGQLNGVRVVPNVPDVQPYIARATLSIAPLLIARGTQNKVLEAMAMGKPVVATSLALEGIDASAGIDVWRADSTVEWISALTRLADDPVLRRQIGSNAREFVLNFHDWTECLRPIDKILASHMNAPPRQVEASDPGELECMPFS